MGAAVLVKETGVMESEDDVWSGEEDLADKGNVWDALAHRLRLAGHDAVAVCEGDGGDELLKYFDKNGRVRRRNEENDKSAIN